MQEPVQGLVVARATTHGDLESMAYVRGHVSGLPEPPPVENLRHHLDTSPALTYLVAHIDGEPAGCGFVDTTSAPYADGDISVVPALRSSGVGSALLAAASRAAHDLGKGMLQGHVREDDLPSRRWVERRGFRAVGAEKGLTLDLADRPPFVGPP